MEAALGRAVWRNDLQDITDILAKEPALVNCLDEESGWTALHSALYFGHIRAAAQLLRSGARLDSTDRDDRTPLELISKELPLSTMSRTEVFSWGSGVNFQLGTGNSGLQTPRRLDKLTDMDVTELAASKFHSMALSKDGRVLTWGWGVGGRLGHADEKLHAGNGAQIFPRVVRTLLSEKVISIAAAKHHALAVTSTGDVYSWGLNPDGRLGYTGANKQVTPKRIGALKGVRVIHAAAANKHSAVVSDAGAVYTWGSNGHGQLGYGTTDSGSNPNPHCVESLKHKSIAHVSLAKKHSLALTEDGDIYSWGHKCVAPKQIPLTGSRASEAANRAGQLIQFHRGSQKVKRPLAVMIAAGAMQSCCLTSTGVVLCWNSASPRTGVKEINGKLSGKKAISIAAGKSLLAATTSDGRVYTWENDGQPEVVHGMKNASLVAVGERHVLGLQKWNAGHVMTSRDSGSDSVSLGSESGMTMMSSQVSLCSDLDFDDNSFQCLAPIKPRKGTRSGLKSATVLQQRHDSALQSLQRICEKSVARHVLDPRTAVGLFRVADTIGAQFLKDCCRHVLVHNLALVIHESQSCLSLLPDDLLLQIEQSYQKEILHMHAAGIGNWWLKEETEMEMCSRRPSYRFPSGSVLSSSAKEPVGVLLKKTECATPPSANRFLPSQNSVKQMQHIQKKLKQSIQKKLQQIRTLLQKQSDGVLLDPGQRAKVSRKSVYEKALDAINAGASCDDIQKLLAEDKQNELSAANSKSLFVEKPLSEKKLVKPQPSPNLWPVIPKSRDVGPLPRFLEPCRKKSVTRNVRIPYDKEFKANTTLDGAKVDVPVEEEKKWVTLELQSTTRSQGSLAVKAISSKDVKMSLSDFLAAPVKPPPPPKKERGPAWGGVRSSSLSSFESIQEEQRNHRPGMLTTGSKPAVERRLTVGRWQLHADVQTQSINAIQIEEKAVQELASIYKDATVKVKTGTARLASKTNNKGR